MSYQDILRFWFGEDRTTYRSDLWWHGRSVDNPSLRSLNDVDNYIRERWKPILDMYDEKHINLYTDEHPLKDWTQSLEGQVALIILFDQFPRHVFRGASKSFAFDEYATRIAKKLLHENMEALSQTYYTYELFTYVALMHSEQQLDVLDAHLGILQLARKHSDQKGIGNHLTAIAKSCRKHHDIIQQFGRYPHRNSILGRESTKNELNFLKKGKLPKWMASVSKTADLKKKSSKKCLKILVLHSNRQTGESFENKTKNYVGRTLGEIADLVYANAPQLYYPSGEIIDVIKSNEYTTVPNVGFTKSWWNATDDPKTMVYRGLEASLEYIDSLFEDHDFDGILGFSQGGALTGIIAGMVNDANNNLDIPVKIPNICKKLRFVAIISGFYCRDVRPGFYNTILEEIPESHQPNEIKIRKNLITLPSFHSWGSADQLVDPWRSEKLSEAFADKEVHVHQSSHFIRAIKHWPMDKMSKWLHRFIPKHVTDVLNIGDRCNEIIVNNTISQEKLDQFMATLGSQKDNVPVNHEHPGSHGSDGTLARELLSHAIRSTGSPSTPSAYSGNLVYELAVRLFGEKAAADNLLTSLRDENVLWKHLISLDTNTESDKLRPILVQLLTSELISEYKAFCLQEGQKDRGSDKPSDLALYAPKRNTTYKNSGLFGEVAYSIADNFNIYDSEKSRLVRSTDDEDKHKVSVYIQYQRLKTALNFILKKDSVNGIVNKPYANSSESVKIIKAPVVFKNIKDGMKTPLSDAILNPRAEPMELSPPEQLKELHQFLRDEENIPVDMGGKNMMFQHGTIFKSPARLDLCKQMIGKPGIDNLMKSLYADSGRIKPYVEHLLLGNNVCGNRLGTEIAEFIKSKKSKLITWYIAGNDLDAEGIEPICDALRTDTLVEQLWLKRNPLKSGGALHLSTMLQFNTTLKVLDLVNTGLLDEGAALILNNIPANLRCLYLSCNGLTAASCQLFGKICKKDSFALEHICFGCNRVADEGAKYMGDVLLEPDSPLRTVSLSSCAISAKGIKYIADAMKINNTLVVLKLGLMKATRDLGEIPNCVGSEGAVYLSEALRVNKTLRGLDLTFTQIQQHGIATLADTFVKDNKTLIYFNYEQFGIPHNELSREMIRTVIKRNHSLISKEDAEYAEYYLHPPHINEILSITRIE